MGLRRRLAWIPVKNFRVAWDERLKSYIIEGCHCIIRCNCTHIDGQTDLDHVKSRGAGGKDSPWNLMPLCRAHHTARHALGVRQMAAKYWRYRKWLERNGWYYCIITQKWRHSS